MELNVDLTFKTKLNLAFKAMRKAGLLARQNYKCCQNCGGYALTTEAEKLVKAGKTVNGCCFYHHQDAAVLRESRSRSWRAPVATEYLYLAYGDMSSNELGNIGLSTAEVGKIVVRCLVDAGLDPIWNGSTDQRIKVTVN
jgi:hypothetical protein